MTAMRRNSAWNIAEVLINSVAIFVLYKLIAQRLGVGALGVWSLVLAATSLGRLADAGISSGLSRYVAISRAREDDVDGVRTLAYVETGLMANLILYVGLAIILYLPAWWGLSFAVGGAALVEARALLPYAVAAFVIANASAVLTAALVGLHRSDLKSKLTLFSVAVQLLVSLFAINRAGLAALAIAQLVQFGLVAVLGWMATLRLVGRPMLGRLPYRIGRAELRDLFGFGIRLQAVNVSGIAFEPAVKFVVARAAGVEMLGLFEMAWRFITSMRQVLVAPTQNLLPVFATLDDPATLKLTYERAFTLLSVATVLVMTAAVAGSPVLIWLWLGTLDWRFVITVALLAPGWILNIASVPAFTLGIARGYLTGNIVSNVLLLMIAPPLILLAAPSIGYAAAGLGASIALAIGAVVAIRFNLRHMRLAGGGTDAMIDFMPRQFSLHVRGVVSRR